VCRTAKKRGQQVPVDVTLRVVAEAARGLHFAHEVTDANGRPLNVVHRDVSPSNVFITYTGQVKVLDFGIAKAESRVTQTTAGVVKGKYQYMSPEQASGGEVDRRSDIYSLGVTMYEALTGVRPFARDTDLAILNAVLKHEYTPLRVRRPDLHPDIEAIVERAMAARPEDRYPTAEALALDIERFLATTTSGSGGHALAHFMKGFFGEARVVERTRIPTLTELRASGVAVPDAALEPGAVNAPTQADVRPNDTTKVVSAPATASAQAPTRGRGARWPWLAVPVVVLAAAAVVAFARFQPRPEPVPAPATGGTDIAAPAVDAGAAPVLDAGAPAALAAVGTTPSSGQEATADAGAGALASTPDVSVTKTESPPGPRRPVVLTTSAVQRVVAANKGRLEQCFKDHKEDLPTTKGNLTVEFAIASSGRVSGVRTELEGTGVARCVAGVMKSLRFPPHVDQEVRVPIALSYDVR
jgi:serine/threonine-protein kinase